MSKIHILESTGRNRYRIVVHGPVPNGSNDAGVSWTTAIVNGGLNTSSMSTGSGPGQITVAELGTVTNGTVIEGEFEYSFDPTISAAARNALLDAEATARLAERGQDLQRALRFFGAVRP